MTNNYFKNSTPRGDELASSTSVNVPSVIHSLPWLLGWVWLSVMGPVFAFKLFSKVGRGLFQRYCCSKDKLSGKVVLITGASSGLGAAVARALYARGCRLILVARSLDKLTALKEELLSSCKTPLVHEPLVVQLDITDLTRVPAVLGPVIAKLSGGAVDILINNAGQSYRGVAADTLIDVDLKLMLVNYFGHVAVTKTVLPGMIRQRSGHILSVSSVQGRLAIPFRSCYAASKHALQGYMDCLRAEVAGHNITVAVLSPAYIATDLSLNAVTGQGDTYGVMDATTASGMSVASVSQHITAMLESGQEDSLLCPWHYRAAVAMRSWTPDLLSFIMKRRASKQGTASHKHKHASCGKGGLEDSDQEGGNCENIGSGLASGGDANLRTGSDSVRRRAT